MLCSGGSCFVHGGASGEPTEFSADFLQYYWPRLLLTLMLMLCAPAVAVHWLRASCSLFLSMCAAVVHFELVRCSMLCLKQGRNTPTEENVAWHRAKWVAVAAKIIVDRESSPHHQQASWSVMVIIMMRMLTFRS